MGHVSGLGFTGDSKRITTQVTLYPINGVTESWQDDPFDHSKLPAQIVSDVTIENVKAMFNEQTFSWVGSEMGKRDLETLAGVSPQFHLH